MKIALFADNNVGLEILRFLFAKFSKDIEVIFCTSENEIFELALQNNLNCEIFVDSEETIKVLDVLNIELGVLAWWPYIVSKQVISSVKYGFVNTHNSYLPNNRGKHPYYWAVIERCDYGVTLHWVDEGIDTGDIIAQEPIEIGWEDDAESIYKNSLEKMIELFKKTYPSLRNGETSSTPQANFGSSHYSYELDNHSEIRLDEMYTARDLLNILRARTTSSEAFKAAFFNDCGKIYRVKVSIEKQN